MVVGQTHRKHHFWSSDHPFGRSTCLLLLPLGNQEIQERSSTLATRPTRLPLAWKPSLWRERELERKMGSPFLFYFLLPLRYWTDILYTHGHTSSVSASCIQKEIKKEKGKGTPQHPCYTAFILPLKLSVVVKQHQTCYLIFRSKLLIRASLECLQFDPKREHVEPISS